MAVLNRHSNSSDVSPVDHDQEKGITTGAEYQAHEGNGAMGSDGAIAYDDHAHLHRGLKSRHITMIAIGGAIGTGLIIGSGTALVRGGPLGLFLGYTFMGIVCYMVSFTSPRPALCARSTHDQYQGFGGPCRDERVSPAQEGFRGLCHAFC